MTNDETLTFENTLLTLGKHERWRGEATFTDFGLVYTGVPETINTLIGNPERTFFVPYGEVKKLLFDAPELPAETEEDA